SVSLRRDCSRTIGSTSARSMVVSVIVRNSLQGQSEVDRHRILSTGSDPSTAAASDATVAT
ncbi:MAG: hypothetical protein AAFQ33_10375, partial [Pseudomonadota bacterium]